MTNLRLLDYYGYNDFKISCNEVAEKFIQLAQEESMDKIMKEANKHIYK